MHLSAQSFGGRLKEERERLGLSQQNAAELCGVRREMWGKYERDAAEPGARVLERFSAQGADVLYVLTGRKEPNIKVSAEELEGTVNPVRLATITMELNRQFDRQDINPDLFRANNDEENGTVTARRVARIAMLSAEIYNELFLEPPEGSAQEVIRSMALGAAMAERSRLKPVGE